MYKKISIALCIVITLCFVVPLFYLWWNMEPKVSQPFLQIKGPIINLYLEDLHYPNRTKLLHDFLSAESPENSFILNRSLWESFLPISKLLLFQNFKAFVLECHSNVPVKWEYFGNGGLVSQTIHYDRREVQDFYKKESYSFTTAVKFLEVSEQISGDYVCSTIEYPENSNYVHLYVKGYETFISPEEIRKEVEPDEEILVPCPISDPDERRNIVLQKILPLHSNVVYIVDDEILRNYDPRIGYTLEPGNWASYQCVNNVTREASGITRIFKPRRLVVAGEYFIKSFTPLAKNDSALKILCEATENITLKFINFHHFRRKPVLFTNTTSSFPYTIRTILRNEWFTDYSRVECVTELDERVLRVWVYLRKETSDKTKVQFNPERKGFECCTDPEAGMIPRLTQAACFTQTECEMKRSCVKLEKSCPHSDILRQPIDVGDPGCALAKVEKASSGVLECSYGNQTKTYVYYYYQSRNRNKKEEFEYYDYTSSDFRKKKVPVQNMLRLWQEEGLDEELVKFTCTGPKFFFANGFQWGLARSKVAGAKVELLAKNELNTEENPSQAEVSESVYLNASKLQNKFVLCFAPVVYSHEWVNATVRYRKPFSVQGDE